MSGQGICAKSHDAVTRGIVTSEIDFSQRFDTGRHACAACAYERGCADGAAQARSERLQILDEFTGTLLTELQTVSASLNTFIGTIEKSVKWTRKALGLS